MFFQYYVGGAKTDFWTLPLTSTCASGMVWSVAGVKIGSGGYVYAVLNSSTISIPPTRQSHLYKFTLGGTVVWNQQIGANATSAAGLSAVTIGGTEYIVVTGDTSDAITGTTPIGGSDGFAVAFNNSGTQQWARRFGSSGNETVRAMVTNPIGTRIYAVGHTNGLVSGATSLTGTAVVSNAGLNDALIVEIRTDAVPGVTRTVQFGSSGGDSATAVSYDASLSRLVVAGETDSSLSLARLGGGGQDAFWVSILNSTFQQAIPVQQFGSAGNETVRGVFSPALTSDVFISGSTTGSLSFKANPDGNNDVFLSKYSASGNFIWDWQSVVAGNESGGLLASEDAFSEGPAPLYMGGSTDVAGWPISGGLGAGDAYLLMLEGY